MKIFALLSLLFLYSSSAAAQIDPKVLEELKRMGIDGAMLQQVQAAQEKADKAATVPGKYQRAVDEVSKLMAPPEGWQYVSEREPRVEYYSDTGLIVFHARYINQKDIYKMVGGQIAVPKNHKSPAMALDLYKKVAKVPCVENCSSASGQELAGAFELQEKMQEMVFESLPPEQREALKTSLSKEIVPEKIDLAGMPVYLESMERFHGQAPHFSIRAAEDMSNMLPIQEFEKEVNHRHPQDAIYMQAVAMENDGDATARTKNELLQFASGFDWQRLMALEME